MAVSKIKAPQVKEFLYTGTTSAAGTLSIPDVAKPSDFHCVVGIKGTSNGNYYVVQYDAYTFGVFRFDHVALANQSISVTFMYV